MPRGLDPSDMSEVIGGATVAPLLKAMVKAIRRAESLSPGFDDGVRAQAVLDAVVEAAATRSGGGGWVKAVARRLTQRGFTAPYALPSLLSLVISS